MYKMSESDMRRRSRKSRKLVGGRGWFGNDAVGTKTDVKNVKQQFDKLIADLKKQIEELEKKIEAQNIVLKKIEEKLDSLDKWRWIVVGMATVAGYILSKIFGVKIG